MSKFGSFMKSVEMIASISELHFWCRRFIMLIQMKGMISMSYGSSTISWKWWRWMRHDLIFLMRDIYIYIYISPWTHSLNSVVVAEVPTLKISSYETSLKWSQRPSQLTKELPWAVWWKWASTFKFQRKSLETDMIKIFQ